MGHVVNSITGGVVKGAVVQTGTVGSVSIAPDGTVRIDNAEVIGIDPGDEVARAALTAAFAAARQVIVDGGTAEDFGDKLAGLGLRLVGN